MPTGAVKVDRTTPWGNPFDHRGPGRDRTVAIREYAAWLGGEGPDELPAGHRAVSRSWVLAHLDELAGHPLACWCPLDGPCHADVLAAHAPTSGPARPPPAATEVVAGRPRSSPRGELRSRFVRTGG